MRIALTSLALSTAIAASLTVSAQAGVMIPAMTPAGGANLHLVQHGGGGMSHGPSMGAMPRAGGAMPGTLARGGGVGGGVGGPVGGGARSPAMPGSSNSGAGQEGEFLALPGFGGPVIPDSTPMRQPSIPSVPIAPGQSTLPAPPTVND